MSYRNERFNRTFLSFDLLAEMIDLGKSPSVSDNGAYVQHLTDHLDTPPGEAARHRRETDERHAQLLVGAILQLIVNRRKNLALTLALIGKNGNNRELSICEMAKAYGISYEAAARLYKSHLTALLHAY